MTKSQKLTYQELELVPSPNVRFLAKGPPTMPDRAIGNYQSYLYWSDAPDDPDNESLLVYQRYIKARTLPGAARQAVDHMSRWTEKSKPPMDQLGPWIQEAILEDLAACAEMIRNKKYEIRDESNRN